MTYSNLVGLYVDLDNKTDFYWNFYVAAALALVGWILARESPLQRPVKTGLTLGLAFFWLMNYTALAGTYDLMEACLNEMQLASDRPAGLHAQLREHVPLGRSLLVMIHLVVDALLVALLWRHKPASA